MDPQQGIMALPESDQAPAPQLSLDESYDAVRQGLNNASPQASQMVDQTLQQFKPMLEQLDDKDLDRVLQIIQYLKENEAEYPELLQNLIDRGALEAGVFPEEYNPEFLATLMMVLTSERKDREAAPQPEMAPPPGMARGGIAEAAQAVMSQGRSGDTMLAHINPREAKILEAHGGMGTINPTTGLREYSFWSDPIGSISGSLNDLGNSVKDVVSSPIGRLITTVALTYYLGPVGGSLATSVLAQDDPKEALINAATAFFTSGADLGIQNAALNSAAAGALVGTGAGLLRGKNLEDSVKAGLMQGAIAGASSGLQRGFGANSTSYDLANPSPLDGGGGGDAPVGATDASGADVSSGADTGVLPPNLMDSGADAASAVQGGSGPDIPAPKMTYATPAVDGPTSVAPPVPKMTYATPAVDGPTSVAPVTGGDMGPGIQTTQNTQLYGNNTGGNMGPGPKIVAPPAVTGYPSYGEASGNIFSGAKQMLPGTEGSFGEGYNQFSKGIGQLYSPSLSKDQLMQTPEYLDAMGRGRGMTDALKDAAASNAPSMLRSYAPGVATALGATYAMGGFDQKEQPKTDEQNAIEDQWKAQRKNIADNPGDYYSKGLERFGIIYNDKGEIIGSKPWTPAPTGPVEVAPPPYVPYTPQRYAAAGGIASLASGGYPRRTGQISGPGTETSDSIPAMLSDGEFVVTAKAVRGAGNGSKRAGAKKMYALMHQLERNASRK
jgi:hypothetical protein